MLRKENKTKKLKKNEGKLRVWSSKCQKGRKNSKGDKEAPLDASENRFYRTQEKRVIVLRLQIYIPRW
jgi:hypothetical protein